MKHSIVISNTGEHYACAAEETLLAGMEALARKGIPVGCRGGGCGVCKVRIAAGQVRALKMSRACLSAEEEQQGLVLACRAYPLSDVTVIPVDRLARCITRSRERQQASFLEAARQGLAPN